MTAPPPRDNGLPALPTLFDGTPMAELLNAELGRGQRVIVEWCEPRYVRYKPETSCIVQYDLGFRLADGELTSTTAYVKSFAGSRADQRGASQRLSRMQQRAAEMHGPSPMPLSVPLPPVGGLLHVFPVDFELRFLVRASSRDGMQSFLRKYGDGLEDDVCVAGAPELVRYKPERKAMLRYRLENGPVETLYGKVHATERIEQLAGYSRALQAGGVATPPALVAVPRRSFIAHAGAEGEVLASLRGSDAYAGWMRPLVDALVGLQGARVPEAPLVTLTDNAIELATTTHLLGIIVPSLRPRLDAMFCKISDGLASISSHFTTCHGDFYDDQALVSDRGVTLVDLDELRTSHPLLDPSNMLAHLSVAEWRGLRVNAARDAFHGAVLDHLDYPDRDLAVFEAMQILKLAVRPFRRMEPDWPERVEQIVLLAELAMSRSRIATPTTGGSSSQSNPAQWIADDALPQLRTLQERDTMSQLVAVVLGDPSAAVADIAVVRHKAWRRATLRYRISRVGRDEIIFGKTFASDRGARVYETWTRIAEARAFGDDVAVPEPVALVPEVKLLMQRAVPGEPIEPELLAGNRQLAVMIAAALHRFHTSQLDLDRSHDPFQELAPLPMRVNAIARVNEELGLRAQACLNQILETPASAFRWRHQPVHRDFYSEQLLLDGQRLAVLDLDDAAMSEPLVDVANFAAHLRLLRAKSPGYTGAIHHVELAFVAHYRDLDAGFSDDLMRFLSATTLVRLAGIHVSRANGEQVASGLLEETEVLLSD